MNILLFGGSYGLGDGLSAGIPKAGDLLWLISRSEPKSLNLKDGVRREWIQIDLSTTGSLIALSKVIQQQPIDVLIYSAGTWESNDIGHIPNQEIEHILNVNLSCFVAAINTYLENLKASSGAKVIAIGSTAGLENANGPRVAYCASKFGLRGAIHSARDLLRPYGIAVTCISPGGMATDIAYEQGPEAALEKYDGKRIPIADLVTIIRAVCGLSSATCVKEIMMPAMYDLDA